MPVDFTPFFKKYEALVAAADKVFTKVQEEYPACVKCQKGCADCCHALFDLTLIEALYLNHHFNNKFELEAKNALIEKANTADRQIYKIKRTAYKEMESGRDEAQILAEMAQKRVRCPLLNDDTSCDLYDYRPITCRFYGIPTAIGGKGYTCGKSAFEPGEPYPTVNLDLIHRKLYEISDELAQSIKSKYSQMGEMLVPVSMAMVTVYDDEYLGISEEKKEESESNG